MRDPYIHAADVPTMTAETAGTLTQRLSFCLIKIQTELGGMCGSVRRVCVIWASESNAGSMDDRCL